MNNDPIPFTRFSAFLQWCQNSDNLILELRQTLGTDVQAVYAKASILDLAMPLISSNGKLSSPDNSTQELHYKKSLSLLFSYFQELVKIKVDIPPKTVKLHDLDILWK